MFYPLLPLAKLDNQILQDCWGIHSSLVRTSGHHWVLLLLLTLCLELVPSGAR